MATNETIGGVALNDIIFAFVAVVCLTIWSMFFYSLGKQAGGQEVRYKWICNSIDNLKKDIKKATESR